MEYGKEYTTLQSLHSKEVELISLRIDIDSRIRKERKLISFFQMLDDNNLKDIHFDGLFSMTFKLVANHVEIHYKDCLKSIFKEISDEASIIHEAYRYSIKKELFRVIISKGRFLEYLKTTPIIKRLEDDLRSLQEDLKRIEKEHDKIYLLVEEAKQNSHVLKPTDSIDGYEYEFDDNFDSDGYNGDPDQYEDDNIDLESEDSIQKFLEKYS